MKKEYVAPSMEIIKIETMQILAGSGSAVEASDELYNGPLNAPRRHSSSVWDEE